MISEFLRFVERLHPPVFVMENVPNLKGINGGDLYRQIIKDMESIGYNVSSGVLLAADFGSPQLRRRLFFVGCSKNLGTIGLPLPSHSPELQLFGLPAYVTVAEAFVNLPKAEFSR